MISRTLLLSCLFLAFCAFAEPNSEVVGYDRLQQKSVHNAYQRKESLADMLYNRGMRSVELDIHIDKSGRPRQIGDWYVYHSKDDSKSSVDSLSQGLNVLREFNLSHPNHEVLTLWMDLKQGFLPPDHRPEDLDQLFRRSLGSALLTPAELLQNCPDAESLQASVQLDSCAWLSAGALRGRILIVLTEAPIMDYVENGVKASERQAFIAPRVSRLDEVDRQRFAVFFNFDKDTATNSDLARGLLSRHLIGRTWDLNDSNVWKKAKARGVHHLATNKVDEAKDPWSTTKQSDGGLFAILQFD